MNTICLSDVKNSYIINITGDKKLWIRYLFGVCVSVALESLELGCSWINNQYLLKVFIHIMTGSCVNIEVQNNLLIEDSISHIALNDHVITIDVWCRQWESSGMMKFVLSFKYLCAILRKWGKIKNKATFFSLTLWLFKIC